MVNKPLVNYLIIYIKNNVSVHKVAYKGYFLKEGFMYIFMVFSWI